MICDKHPLIHVEWQGSHLIAGQPDCPLCATYLREERLIKEVEWRRRVMKQIREIVAFGDEWER